MKVLILADIQNDFLPGGTLAVPKGDQIIPVVNKLQDYFELVVATQDWHPLNHKSFASNHQGKKPFDVIELRGLHQVLWPNHCVQGSKGAEFSPQLDMTHAEAIFRKGTDPEIDSYSGFFDNGHLKSTCLEDYLRGKKVDQVYVSGLCGDICVFYTAMDSLAEGFETYIIEDATRPLKFADFKKTNKQFTERGGRLTTSSEIME
ncbi:MAG TPA: bifunctional nicotinamidase/pyrazinamidase [Chitinophagaceae bacterium]|nr:bifunctional nicotinamidase/pyrazinamidase [Chitinophagaceae bacterium]